jgi:hypothetical protein
VVKDKKGLGLKELAEEAGWETDVGLNRRVKNFKRIETLNMNTGLVGAEGEGEAQLSIKLANCKSPLGSTKQFLLWAHSGKISPTICATHPSSKSPSPAE